MRLLILTIMVLFAITAQAQLDLTADKVIAKNGTNYKGDIANDGSPYVTYTEYRHTESSGNFERLVSYYFNRETGKCFLMRIIEPSSEAYLWMMTANKTYNKVSDTRWVDSETNSLLVMKIREGMVVIDMSRQ